MGLKLVLKPGERLVVNGAMLANGQRRTELLLETRAAVLRGRDLMRAEEATTPARQLYFEIMSAYLETGPVEAHLDRISGHLGGDLWDVRGAGLSRTVGEIANLCARREFYAALSLARDLINIEDRTVPAAGGRAIGVAGT
ncbi:MAG: flagellar biosynthesis repressor FlbT [Pacificimonas sp.]|jgi:flagellar protein FlbT|nr:flagellar biosynthesis repressor FlbT [Pacificimonas sp.]